MKGTLAGASALAAPALLRQPAFAQGQKPLPSEAEVLVIGAGAAGIAAARRIVANGRSCLVIEADDKVGGRVKTDRSIFGVPFDLGAQRLHLPARNPLVGLGREAGLTLSPAPAASRLYLDGKEASDSAYEDFVATVRRGVRAIGAAGDAGRDLPARRVLPDLGPFGASADFVLGPFMCAKELEEVSTVDFSRKEDLDESVVCREGLGTLLERLAQGLDIQLQTIARTIDLDPRQLQVSTNRGSIRARMLVVAVPPSVIASGRLKFLPGLVPRYRQPMERITLGTYDHMAFELPGNPLDLEADELIHVKAENARAFALVGRVAGTDIHCLEVGGAFGASLSDGPDGAGAAFVKEALTRHFGPAVAAKMGRVHQTRWSKAPFSLGAFSCALPGAGNLRRMLTEVVSARMVFAGEHTHETLWGTVGGAWASGERAADQVLRILAGGPATGPAARAPATGGGL